MSTPIETTEDILDTIEVCESYLADAADNAAGAFAHLFTADAIAFAKGQVAFEEAKLEVIRHRENLAGIHGRGPQDWARSLEVAS
jgi:hypothetical protein